MDPFEPRSLLRGAASRKINKTSGLIRLGSWLSGKATPFASRIAGNKLSKCLRRLLLLRGCSWRRWLGILLGLRPANAEEHPDDPLHRVVAACHCVALEMARMVYLLAPITLSSRHKTPLW